MAAGWRARSAARLSSLAAFALAALVLAPAFSVPAFGQNLAPRADFAGRTPSAEARRTADLALATGDHQQLPFAVVDKKNARLYVFGADGRLVGDTAVLLGSAVSDRRFPGLNQRDLSRLAPEERTTPAGRFVSEPGHNLHGEAIVWVDYDSAFAIHRLRPAPAREPRAERLASPTAADNRISLGCVVTPVAFYEQVVGPVLGRSRAIVYVLPEAPGASGLFGDL